MPDKVFVDRFFFCESVRVLSCFVSDVCGDVLSMLAGDDRVIQDEFVVVFHCVFKVELSHFDVVGKQVQRQFFSLSDSDELFVCI